MPDRIDDPFEIGRWPDPNAGGRGRRARNHPTRVRPPADGDVSSVEELFGGAADRRRVTAFRVPLQGVPAEPDPGPAMAPEPQHGFPAVGAATAPVALPVTPLGRRRSPASADPDPAATPPRGNRLPATPPHLVPPAAPPTAAMVARRAAPPPEPVVTEVRAEPEAPTAPEVPDVAPVPPEVASDIWPGPPTGPASFPIDSPIDTSIGTSRPASPGLLEPFVDEDPHPGEPDPPTRGRRPRVVVGAVLVGAMAGVVWGLLHPAVVASRTDVVVDASVNLAGGEATGAPTQRDVATQAALLRTPSVRTAAVKQLGWSDFSASVTVPADSDVISLTVAADTRNRTAAATRAYAAAYQQVLARQQKAGLVAATAVAQEELAASGAPGAQQRLARLTATAQDLPANVTVLAADRPHERGYPLWMWVVLGIVAGAGAGAALAGLPVVRVRSGSGVGLASRKP